MRNVVALGGEPGCEVSNDKDELRIIDAAMDREALGLALQTAGYMILGFCSITCVWIFVGWRVGSWFWFWVTLALAVMGMGAAAAGSLIGGRADATIAARSATMRARLLKVENHEELPPDQDLGRKAA